MEACQLQSGASRLVDKADNFGNVVIFSSIDLYPDPNPDPFVNTRKIHVMYYDTDHGALRFAEYSCFPDLGGRDIFIVQDADYMGAPT